MGLRGMDARQLVVGVTEPTPHAARVALMSDRWLSPEEWRLRGMTVTRPGPVVFERLVASASDAILLDATLEDNRQVTNCWQLHDLLGVPIIILADGASTDEVLALLERGADEVVCDSADGALLAAQVAAILRRVQGRQHVGISSTLRLGRVEVDMARRIVVRPDGTQTLSRTEFALLQALVHARGRACSRAELISRVWGPQYVSATHYLRLYIRYLRQKLEFDPVHPAYILNVHSVGYRLTTDDLPAGQSSSVSANVSGTAEPQDAAVPSFASV